MPDKVRTNVLGDVRAEHDHVMLDNAFYEWQGYKSLIEADDRYIVVGRRGTGKSALTYKLMKDCEARKDFVIVIKPDEEDVIGLRSVAAKYGSTVPRIRAALKIGWRYALMMEIANNLAQYYKTSQLLDSSELKQPLKEWSSRGNSAIRRLRLTLNGLINPNESQEDNIAELAYRLNIETLQNSLRNILQGLNKRVVVLIDRLDEGYEPDDLGIGIVDGIIYGTEEIHSNLPNTKAVLFLRDNIFRAIQRADGDYSRNIEGNVLRLHWDKEELFYLACKRLRSGLRLDVESDIKLWNKVTESQLHGVDGFKRCLQMTLYRPRDVISLLNNAFVNANKHQRDVLINDDLKASAKYISEVRFNDLSNEYASVFPGINLLTKAFSGYTSKLTISEARGIVTSVSNRQDLEPQVKQHLEILGSPDEIIKGLYSIGFLGLLDRGSNNYIFCHDGRTPDNTLSDEASLLIHPCYWTALNISSDELESNTAEEIYDEYEITIISQSKETRDKKIGQLIAELNHIDMGDSDAHVFEDWCKRVIELIFAGQLTNIQLRPNSNAAARRDIVGTNEALDGFWKRILKDYNTRQVIFEVKNYEKLSISEYRQVYSYLKREYGKCAFIICRDKVKELSKGAELEAFREYYGMDVVIIKLTASVLVNILQKIRSPQKFDAAEDIFKKHLDEHIRLYANGQTNVMKKKKAK